MNIIYNKKSDEWITDKYIIRGDAIDGYRVFNNDDGQTEVFYNLYFESILHWILGLV